MLVVFVGAVLVGGSFSRRPEEDVQRVTREPFYVWSIYDGKLAARRVEVIMSHFSGPATIAELASEGRLVERGDLLVRFDETEVERELVKLKRDYALAKSELDSLQHAKLPMEIRDLELRMLESRASYESEKQYLDDSVQLMKEELVSAQEIEQQKLKVERALSGLKTLEMKMKLTQKYLHPSRLERGRASLLAAERALELARKQLENCVVRAPSAGMVVHRALHIGSEYRTARVGDRIYRNQPFMAIPDMTDLVVHCHVPEAELALVQKGKEVVIVPLAYPDLRLKGKVETVGSMAQGKPGHAGWQKYFRVVIAVQEPDPRLRSGMSVRARILSYSSPSAVVVPRSAVQWDEDTPYCFVREWRRSVKKPIRVGRANHRAYEVLEGLAEGDAVTHALEK